MTFKRYAIRVLTVVTARVSQRTIVGAAMVAVGAASPTVSAQDCQPEIVGSIGGTARDVAVVGSMAFVVSGFGGLTVVDVSATCRI